MKKLSIFCGCITLFQFYLGCLNVKYMAGAVGFAFITMLVLAIWAIWEGVDATLELKQTKETK